MSQDFYPFVENGETTAPTVTEVRHPARIAVYDDPSAAPRVVVVEPRDVRAYLEEITLQVTQLSAAQGGTIPFMVIREIVENLIHAYFMEPTVSILDHGNTIRFSDQGPGIAQKDLALQYGTTSATEEMRRYIRGVGSGLPYVKQYMHDKGGSLVIEDNIAGGTVVTLRAQQPQAADDSYAGAGMTPADRRGWPQQSAPQSQPASAFSLQPGVPGASALGATPACQAPSGVPQQYGAWQQVPAPQQAGGQTWMQPVQGASYVPAPGWSLQQATPYQPGVSDPYAVQAAGTPATPAGPAQHVPPAAPAWPQVSARGRAVLSWLSTHEAVGPSDLARAYGESQPTWTRELQALEEAGLVRKDGQKRRLTALGATYPA